MKVENIKIWAHEEYNYKMAYGFIPNIRFYLHEDENKRPFMLVVPGGGYGIVSYTESEVVAEVFFNKGYNVGVLAYTVNIVGKEPLKKQPLNDIARAIRYIRRNGDKFNLCVDKLCICGFSAGGHLSGSIAVHYDDIDETNEEYINISARPDAVILSYPVITFGEYTHKGSVENLISKDAYMSPEKYKDEIEYFSLEKQVTTNTPPCLIWHTATDASVPVENAYMFAQALQKVGVHYALHVFSYGPHGLSVANDRWRREDFGEPYTYEQLLYLSKAMEIGELCLTSEEEEILVNRNQMYNEYKSIRGTGNREPNEEVEIWVDVAEKWLNNIFKTQ